MVEGLLHEMLLLLRSDSYSLPGLPLLICAMGAGGEGGCPGCLGESFSTRTLQRHSDSLVLLCTPVMSEKTPFPPVCKETHGHRHWSQKNHKVLIRSTASWFPGTQNGNNDNS